MGIDYLFLLLVDHQVCQLQLSVGLCNFIIRLSLVLRELTLKLIMLFCEYLQLLGDISSVIAVFKDVDVPVEELERCFVLL